MDRCSTCNGSGVVGVPDLERGGMTTETCDDCAGSGVEQ